MIDWQSTKVCLVIWVVGMAFYLALGKGYIGHTIGCLLGWAVVQVLIYNDKKRHAK